MNADETFATIMMLVEQAPLPVKDEDWVLFDCSPWKGSSEHATDKDYHVGDLWQQKKLSPSR